MLFSFSAAAVALLGLMVASASGAEYTLNCSCTTLPGGKVGFDLSPAPPYNCGHWQWFCNGAVIAAKNDTSQDLNATCLVLNATHQSLTLESFSSHVHFEADSLSGYFKADCTTNCSSPTPAPEILPERVTVLVLVLVPMALVLVLLLVWFRCPKFRSWTQKIPPWIQTRITACIRPRVCGTEPPPSSSSPEFEKVPLSDVPRTETV